MQHSGGPVLVNTEQLSSSSTPAGFVDRLKRIIARLVEQRIGTSLERRESRLPVVSLALSDRGGDGFEVTGDEKSITITGDSASGLLFGVGRFLHTSTYRNGNVAASTWRGRDEPESPVRMLYLATHFHNFYQDAPLHELVDYIEEMALWGYNCVAVWFDRHEFDGIDDPSAQAMLQRLTAILHVSTELGLQTGLIALANEGYKNSPIELRATCEVNQNGYHTQPHGYYGVELCPSKAGVLELLLTQFTEVARRLAPSGIDYLLLWPYDQGGCTCAECAPWGANGFLRCAEPLARAFKQMSPRTQITLSTWYFDHFTDGEWIALDTAFATRPNWVDFLLVGDHGGQPFPDYPARHGVPGGLPAISFPDISMNGMYPWGGFGANVRPIEVAEMWRDARSTMKGGAVYSEGLFEDVNKVTISKLLWSGDADVRDIIHEYAAFEIGEDAVTGIAQLIDVLEATQIEARASSDQPGHGPTIITIVGPPNAGQLDELVNGIEDHIEPHRRTAWRWRHLKLRAELQSLLSRPDPDRARIYAAIHEVARLYWATEGEPYLRPPYAAFA